MLGGVPIRNRCVLRGIVVGPLGIVMSGVDCLGNGLLKKENMARRALYSCCFMVFVDETVWFYWHSKIEDAVAGPLAFESTSQSYCPDQNTFSPTQYISWSPQAAHRTMATAKENETDLYPIAVLIDELKHEDKNVRLNAMKNIKTIGKRPKGTGDWNRTTLPKKLCSIPRRAYPPDWVLLGLPRSTQRFHLVLFLILLKK